MTNSEFVDRQTKEGENDESMLHVQADALIVATGNSQVPNGVPSQLAGFKDRIVHSSAYDESFMQEVADKKLRVLIVGGGESSADISADLCDQSPNLTVWLRRPPCAAMRYLNRLDETQQIKANQTVDFPVSIFRIHHYESLGCSTKCLSLYLVPSCRCFLRPNPVHKRALVSRKVGPSLLPQRPIRGNNQKFAVVSGLRQRKVRGHNNPVCLCLWADL